MRRLTESQLAQLETPCLVVDLVQVRENIWEMQQAVDELGCALRPHIKTHKLPLIARMQVDIGAVGITCAKVSEAEVMADGGLENIFIAYPVIGPIKIKRAMTLARRIKRLILAVDSLEGALTMHQAASEEGIRIEVRMEVDIGAGRTGVPADRAVGLAKAIMDMPGLSLEGIYAYKSLMYAGKPTQDRELAAIEEGDLLVRITEELHEAGIRLQSVSGGSSPTGLPLARTGKVTEIRPGTYVYKDIMLEKEGIAQRDQLALCYVATVVSSHHDAYAVIDGGSKAFATDVPLNSAPGYYDSYAIIEGSSNLRLTRLYEEHGIVTALNGRTGLKVGQKLMLYPIHVCTAVNMHNTVYLLTQEGELIKEPIPARGMLA